MLRSLFAFLSVVSFVAVTSCSGAGTDVASSGAAAAGAGGDDGAGAGGADGAGVGGASGLGGAVGAGGAVVIGTCKSCECALEQPSNVGCEFWAVDLDLSDISKPASQPWGLVIANAGDLDADVTIEMNDAPPGQPLQLSLVNKGTLPPGQLGVVLPPIRIVDCGKAPDDINAPGTCLSSNAFRITSSAPVIVYQFNNFVHAFSSDASLLLPTTALGTRYRVLGWPAAHSSPSPGAWPERAYVTIVGTQPNTHVKVRPTWRIRGNGPIAATPPGGTIEVDLGPFDVLNLEGDDTTLNEVIAAQSPPYPSDLTGSIVEASAPVAVFSGTESSGVGLPEGAPLSPTCKPDPLDPNKETCGCCLQHLEEQLAPLESIGKKYIVTRSPIRSRADLTDYVEPDIIRFVGAAEPANITTTLPPPFDGFTLQPGEIKDTWTQVDFVATSDTPFLVAQFMIAGSYVGGTPAGDPSFTIVPPVEQAQNTYLFLSPDGWEAALVISAEQGVVVNVDGAPPSGCVVAPAGMLDGKMYEARRCKLAAGVHRLSADSPFGIMAYGAADADSYSFAGGAYFKKIYEPPPIK